MLMVGCLLPAQATCQGGEFNQEAAIRAGNPLYMPDRLPKEIQIAQSILQLHGFAQGPFVQCLYIYCLCQLILLWGRVAPAVDGCNRELLAERDRRKYQLLPPT